MSLTEFNQGFKKCNTEWQFTVLFVKWNMPLFKADQSIGKQLFICNCKYHISCEP